jgi:hypothetical protein
MAGEAINNHGQVAESPEPASQQSGLVVTAFAEAPMVQRHRHQDIRR